MGNKSIWPLLCIDSERNIWSNQADKENNLYFDNGIYKGKFPGTHNIANSITQVFGQKWVTIMLPFPEEKIERIALTCHEMFHYWQILYISYRVITITIINTWIYWKREFY